MLITPLQLEKEPLVFSESIAPGALDYAPDITQVGPLPVALAAHLTPYCNAQLMMARAALSGDRKEALHAFLLDPLIQKTLTVEDTAALLDEMLAVNASMLPQFERSAAGVAGG